MLASEFDRLLAGIHDFLLPRVKVPHYFHSWEWRFLGTKFLGTKVLGYKSSSYPRSPAVTTGSRPYYITACACLSLTTFSI